MNNKIEIRKKYLEKRNYLSKGYQKKSSKIIEEKILNYIKENKIKNFLIFLNKDSEPRTFSIIENSLKSDIEVYLPKINGERIEFRKVTNLKKDLEKNIKFNLFEPKDSCKLLKNLNKIKTVFVPIVAFDNELNRIGYGKGYYDKWLKENNYQGIKIGISQQSQFSFEIIDIDSNDVRLDVIITEEKTF